MSMLRRRWPIVLFLGWTTYVWVTRIVNAWSSSDESTTAKVISTVIAVALVGASVWGAAILVRSRTRSFEAGEATALVWLARAIFVVWAVRIPQILLDGGHGVAFKVVHVVLGAISIGLAAWTIAKVRAETITSAGTSSVAPAVSPAAKAAR